jgi:hypothetical protein
VLGKVIVDDLRPGKPLRNRPSATLPRWRRRSGSARKGSTRSCAKIRSIHGHRLARAPHGSGHHDEDAVHILLAFLLLPRDDDDDGEQEPAPEPSTRDKVPA